MLLALRRLVVAVIIGLFALVSLLPVALAAEGQAEVGMMDEAWFLHYRQPIPPEAPIPDDPNDGPLGDAGAIGKATVRDNTNVYNREDGESLHVGVDGGRPKARLFVNFDTAELPDVGPLADVTITGGTVTFVNQPGPEHHNKFVEAAEMIACPATETIADARGAEWSAMPGYDCSVWSPLELITELGDDEPATWTVDLAPLAPFWADAPSEGIAVVEATEAEEAEGTPGLTWHVAFWGRFASQDDAQPIVADLTYTATEEDIPEFPDPADDFPSDDGFPAAGGGGDFQPGGSFEGGGDFDGGGGGFDEGGDFGSADPPEVAEGDMGTEEAEAPEVAMDDGAAQPQAAEPMEEQAAGTMPVLFLLPFLAVGLAGLLGYSLTQEPDLPEEREGAVSKLMRRPGAGGTNPTDAA